MHADSCFFSEKPFIELDTYGVRGRCEEQIGGFLLRAVIGEVAVVSSVVVSFFLQCKQKGVFQSGSNFKPGQIFRIGWLTNKSPFVEISFTLSEDVSEERSGNTQVRTYLRCGCLRPICLGRTSHH